MATSSIGGMIAVALFLGFAGASSAQSYDYRYTKPGPAGEASGPPRAQCIDPFTSGPVEHGQAVTAWMAPTVAWNETCLSEERVCNDGVLAGTYAAPTCMVEQALACSLPWGGTIGHAQSVTAYQAALVPFEAECSSQVRSCVNGDLSGSWSIQACENEAQDLTPNAFVLNAQINLNPGSMAQPAAVLISGVTGNVPVSLANYENEAQLRVCADAACVSIVQDWVAGPATVRNNQYLLLRSRSSSSLATTISNTVTVGAYSTALNSTTSSSYCGGVGGICEDGTVYAGIGDGKPLFVGCDAGMTWSGTFCSGARTGTLRWGDDGQVGSLCGPDCGNGKARSSALSALGSQYEMARYCETMVHAGHDDWYLPSRNEMQQLYNVRFQGALNGSFNTEPSNFPQYATSSETSASNYAVWLFFSGGGASHMPKNYQGGVNTNVRCVRSPV